MKLKDWLGRDIMSLSEDAEMLDTTPDNTDEVVDEPAQDEEFTKNDAEPELPEDEAPVTEDAEEEVDVEVDGDDVAEDDADAFDKEFMKDDTDEEPVEVTSESVKWDKLFR